MRKLFGKTLRNYIGAGAIALGSVLGGYDNVNASQIKITNFTSASGASVSKANSNLNVKYESGASNGLDASDFPLLSPPFTPAIEIYSNPPLHPLGKLSDDARPDVNPNPVEFYLNILGPGTVTGSNEIRFKMLDPTGLAAFDVYAYDSLVPSTTYPINKTLNSVTTVTLPGLVSQGAGEYADWFLVVQAQETNPTPEPSTLFLAGAGLAGLGLYAASKRKKNKE